MNFFRDVNVKDIEECIKYLEPEDRRVTFDQRFKLFSNYMDMLLPDPAAIPFAKDLKWLADIRTRARNRYRDDQLTLNECSEKVKQLIEDNIRADGVSHIIAPTSIFSDKFDEEIKKLSSNEAKASEIEHAIKHEITFKLHEDPVFYESLKERLERILNDFTEGRINAAKQLTLLKDVLDDLRHPENYAKELGVDQKIAPFYNLLKEEKPNDEVKKLAEEIYDGLDELAVVEWSFKEDVKREMRKKIKRLLRAINFDDDEIESMTIKIMDLARARFVR